MSVITSKTIEPNENVHYFAIKTIELSAVRMGILDIAAGFDEKFRFLLKFFAKSFRMDNSY